jgi:hypothetical protein
MLIGQRLRRTNEINSMPTAIITEAKTRKGRSSGTSITRTITSGTGELTTVILTSQFYYYSFYFYVANYLNQLDKEGQRLVV